GDEVLAATADAESDVVLTAFTDSWAAAWRVATTAGELVRVSAKGASAPAWSVGPFPPGPAGVRPALVALDDAHLLLVVTQGLDVDGNGVTTTTKLAAAVLDIAAPGNVVPVDLPASLSRAIGANRPSAAR